MVSDANVITINRREDRPTVANVRYTIGPASEKVDVDRVLGTRDLYPILEQTDSEDALVLRLLDDTIDVLSAAGMPQLDYIHIDTELMRARALLVKAFEHRDTMGEGYASVVNGALWALANACVEPLTQKQILSLHKILNTLRAGPYMTFDSAMELLDELEAQALDIEPASLDELLVQDNG